MRFTRHNNYLIFSFFLFFTACKNNGKVANSISGKTAVEQNTKSVLKLPDSPETLVRAWEENINKNEFEVPRLVSKGEVLDLVNSVEASNADQKLPIFPMKILSLKCDELNNVGNCTCRIQNDTGEQTFLYSLIKDNGQWYLTKVESEDELVTPEKDKSKISKPL